MHLKIYLQSYFGIFLIGVDVEKQCVPDEDNVNATSGSAVNSTSMKHLKIADQYDAGDYDGTGVKERFHTLQSDGNSQRESTDQLNDDDLDVDYRQSTIIQSQSKPHLNVLSLI